MDNWRTPRGNGHDAGTPWDCDCLRTGCRFRARLIANRQSGAAFEEMLRWARAHKMLGRQVGELVDALLLFDGEAVQNPLTVIQKARRKLAESLRHKPEHAEWAKAVLAEPGKTPDVAWDDAAARQQGVEHLAGTGQGGIGADRGATVDGRAGAGTGAVVDPARAGRGAWGARWRAHPPRCGQRPGLFDDGPRDAPRAQETSSGRFDEHKCEIGMDRVAELITHVETRPGNSADDEHLAEKLAETEEVADVRVTQVTGDSAYRRPAARGGHTKAGNGRPRPRDGSTQHPVRQGRPVCNGGAVLLGVRYQQKTCAGCPLRAPCTSGKRQGRTVAIRLDEAADQLLHADHGIAAWNKRYVFPVAVVNPKRLAVLYVSGSLPICAYEVASIKSLRRLCHNCGWAGGMKRWIVTRRYHSPPPSLPYAYMPLHCPAN